MSSSNVKINNGVDWEISDRRCDELVEFLNEDCFSRPKPELLRERGYPERSTRSNHQDCNVIPL